jgi:hypothetical protein
MKPINLNRQKKISAENLNKSNVFIELNSTEWRQPEIISVEDLLTQSGNFQKYDISKDIDKKTIVIDPHTLKIKINDSFTNDSNVFNEPLNSGNINPYNPPRDVSSNIQLHLRSNENYLYVWVGNRWKRVKLEEWED